MGTKIFTLRRNLSLSQAELAARCGVTQQFIQRLEAGNVNPSIQTARKLADVLGVTVDELIREEDEHDDQRDRSEHKGHADPG